MSLINDTEFLIHNLRLSYLRDVEDPYGSRIISLSPSYTSNPYIFTSGLADADRWPELDSTSSPAISEDEQERPLGFPGARLKHTQTIMGRRTGGLGLRVSGKRASTSKRMSVASIGTPRQSDVQNFISDNAPVGGLPASAPTPSTETQPQLPPPDTTAPTSPNGAKPPEPPPKAPQVQIQEPSVAAEVPVTKTVMFIPKFKNAAEMEHRRRIRMAARRRGPGGGPPAASQAPQHPPSFDTTSEEEVAHLNPEESSSETDSDFGRPVAVNESMDEFDPEFTDTRPHMNSDSDIASVVSDISNSLPSITNSSAPYSASRPSFTSNASAVSGSQQVPRVVGPRRNPSSLPRSNQQPPSATKQPTSPAPPSAPNATPSPSANGAAHPQTSTIMFLRRPVPSISSSSKSALSAMLASSSSSPNPFAETYANISGRGVTPAQRVSIQVFFPRAKGIKDGGRDGGRSKVREGMKLSVRKDATVEEVIGFALWTYWEEGWLPPLEQGISKGKEGEDEEEERRIRMSAVGWILRLTEDDGEIDDDFPPPDRSGKISKFNADGFAVLEANAAQLAQNKILESKLAATRPAAVKNPSEKNMLAIPVAGGATGTVLTPTGQSALASSMIGSAPLSTSLGATHGPQMYLRIRVNANADAAHIRTTIPVSAGMYMQEVMEAVCRKPMLGLGDPGDYALLLAEHKLYIPLDRTVASLQGETQLLLVKRSMLPSYHVDVMKAGKTTDPNASIFKRISDPEVKLSSQLDFTAAYKKYTIYRKLPMLVARQEKTLAIDGQYVHIMPSTNNAAKAKAVFETGRTSSFHIKSIADCQQSTKSPHIFKLVLNRADRSGSNKRLYFEAENSRLAGEIVQTVKSMKSQFERSSMSFLSEESPLVPPNRVTLRLGTPSSTTMANNNYPYYPDGQRHRRGTENSSVQDAQSLLSVYPMAAATPSTHVIRHMDNMTAAAPPPTFSQPGYYSYQQVSYAQGNPPPYSEFAREIAYMSGPPAANDGGYWQNTRNQAVNYVQQQANYDSSYQFPASSNWTRSEHPSSNYHTSQLAQTMFNHTRPGSAYPTPPPPSSSSSLAGALGPVEPPAQPPRQQQRIFPPPSEQPAQFFNNFLDQKTRQLSAAQSKSVPTTPHRPKAPSVSESPDPLAIKSTNMTPRKRKPVVEITSPFTKRIHREGLPSTPQRSRTTASTSVTPSSSFLYSPSSVPRTPTTVSTARSTSVSTTQSSGRKRTWTVDYIQVPPAPYLTPTSTRKHASSPSVLSNKRAKVDESPDELAGYGTENDDPYLYSPTKGSDISPTKMSGRRAGDRDDRAPLEKFVKLLQDIFEAEDALPSEADVSDIPTDFFAAQSPDPSQPQLNDNTVRKLTKYIGLVARPTKRSRAANGILNTPRSKARMTEVDTHLLSRALKILTRSVKAGEDVDPFMQTATQMNTKASPKKPSTKKGKKKAEDGRLKSESPSGEAEDKDEAAGSSRPVITDLDIEKLTQKLSVSRDSVLAAECCLALLGSDRLTKQLYSEEMITSCLNSIKNQLTKIVYPFVEASSDTSSADSLLHRLTAKKDVSSKTEAPRRLMGEIFQGLCAVLPRISVLINSDGVAMSDTIIIQVVYIAIGPFFVVDSGSDGDHKGKGKEKDSSVIRTFGKSGMRGLRLDALALIRSIFANHEDQRSWIIEEILSSLIKLSDTKQKAGQFRLRDGRSIRTVSALLLQLVQTSAHDVRVSAKSIERARQQKLAMRRQESFTETQQAPEPFLDEHDKEEIRLYGTGLDSATKAAQTIILFLTQRSGKTKVTKNSNEAEYRTILDNLISDLLVVLFWPEWPAASLLLGIACKYMVASLDDVKTSQKESDNNAAKTIALDHLGIIAARIRSTLLKVQQEHEDSRGKKLLKPMEEIVKNIDINSLDRLLAAHRDVATHLSKRASDDQAYDSAQELTAATLGQELAAALKKADRWIAAGDDDDDDEMNIRESKKDLTFGNKLKEAMRGVWNDQADIFDMGSSEEANRIDRIAEEIGSIQGLLRNCFQPVLNVILTALDAPAVFMRTKALRALGQIVTSDASVLALPNVRQAIETHLLDQSSAVRDAAVELIGKYMIDSPEVASDYYPKIADRMADTGLGVRKRVIKLLKAFYPIADSVPRQVDIATKMVLRMFDEDDTVKELAMKTVEDLWFPTSTMPPSALKSSKNAASAEQNGDAALVNKVAVIMGVSAAFKDRHSPLEDLLHKIMAEKEGAEATALHVKYTEICDALIDGLVDASDLPGFTVINCIRTIHLIASAYPSIITSSSASTLLPYLKNINTAEEHATSSYILKIFRASIPHMPKTAAKFGQELQQILQPMIIKPSTGGLATLQETVACFCVVVQHLTHDYGRLVALLKSLNVRLQELVKKPEGYVLGPNEMKSYPTVIFIVSLLGEHCPFDRFRNDPSVPADVVKNLDAISQGSIVEHIYNTLLKLHSRYEPLRARTMHCLGFLFRAQPTLMVMDSSAQIMDSVFGSSDEEERGRMLKIMQDFLNAEATKHAAKEKEMTKRTSAKASDVNMEELVGNTEGFADSGVSSAVVQRYLTHILDAALSQNPHIQASAIDIMSFTVKQGLAHPLQSFPVIVALETSPFTSLSNRASSLHSILHGKHASLLNTRFVVSARTSFEYQCKISPNDVKGYRLQPMPVAVLHRWYLLVREKRPNRQEFLKSLVKVFNHDNADYHSTQTDTEFVRYMAENFSAFDYKTLEEVLTVIKFLTKILSTTGQHILEVLSPNHLLASIRAPMSSNGNGNSVPSSSLTTNPPEGVANGGADSAQDRQEEDEVLKAVVPPTPNEEKLPILRTSVSIAIVMLLKAHLKTLYSLSEDKCSKFVLGKKSALGDRPATKKHDKPISWERLPFATKSILTTADGEEQKQRFLEIWNEDGVSAEPEDEFDAVAA
ncbi:hypothetical protein D9758_013605 [Tetrapyrgos nigripes]|uniref:Sister chromatid cohesion protein n=1 Tax=Tetrapyrgos nigripes TaxID=182062 RepID=A0A8H5FHZ2_9AGAR|nr:hypothetical protein D9758_013605 [Tetrapyrgos nigripes]